MPYLAHFIISLIGAGIGAYARGFCKHTHHRLMLGAVLIAAETVLTVNLIG
jgi:hypothetical protein